MTACVRKATEERGGMQRGNATSTTEWKELHMFWSHYGHFRPGPCQPDDDDVASYYYQYSTTID